MNYINKKILKKILGNTVRQAGLVTLLVTAVLGTLYVGEANFHTNTEIPFAQAWNCQSMTATPATITAGESSTLAWKFSNDTGVTVTIDQISGKTWNGPTGQTSVSPTATTKYIATAHKVGTKTTTKCDVTVTVKPAPAPLPVCTLTADKTTIEKGEVAKLTWTSDHAVSATMDNGVGAIALNGSRDVTPTATTTYKATFENKDGKKVTCEKTINVTPKPTPTPAPLPVCTLTADKTTIEEGQTAKLTWTSDHAVSATMDNGVGAIALNDSRDVTPSATTTYKAIFTNQDGKEVSCEKTINVTPKPTPVVGAPVCSLALSATNVNPGTQVTLTWDSENVDTVTIDNSVGTVATTGSQLVTINNAVTYTGTFTGKNGTVITCTTNATIISNTDGGGGGGTTVTTTTGGSGGGVCRNCGSNGGGSHTTPSTGGGTPAKTVSPNVVLSSVATPAPYVYLSQVPYTGFTAGPVLTAVFWLAVFMVSVLIAYVMTVPHPLSGIVSVARSLVAKREEKEVHASYAMNTFAPVLQHIFAKESALYSASARDVSSASGNIANTADDFIEERAQKEHILLSPEAVRMVAMEAEHSSLDSETLYTTIFDEAKALFPREDGWILLSKERILSVFTAMQQQGQGTQATSKPQPQVVQTQPASVTQQTRAPYSAALTYREQASKTDAVAKTQPATASTDTAPVITTAQEVTVADFVSLLESGQQQKAFDVLRSLSSQNRAESYIKSVVRGLDDVYKNRIEGGRTPTAELARATATWTNSDFETVLGMLIESVDWSYSSARVGTKIALAKAFEYFESKKAK